MKKIFSVFLAVMLFTLALCVNVSAAADYNVKFSRAYGGGYTYVTIKVADGDIYYTTDGTKPTMDSKEYTGRIKVTKPCTLRVAVYDNGKAQKRYKTSVPVRLKKPTVELFEVAQDGEYVYDIYGSNNAAYYFTTDGTTPSKTNGERAYGSFSAKPGSTVKLRAIKSGWKSSLVVTIKVPGAEQSESAAFEKQVLALVNKERAAYGLTPLKTMTNLSKAAQKRAEEIAVDFAHTRPNGSSCFSVLEEYGFELNRYWCGENIAAGQNTPEAVVESWMNSSGHRANILSENYEYLGVGCYTTNAGYGIYWTQVFLG